MATPIGHGLAGCVVFFFLKKGRDYGDTSLLFLTVFFAIAPDLDFLPGILAGKPALYHHGISHSLVFGLAAGLLGGLAIRNEDRAFFSVFLLTFLAYTSHLVLDLFGPDGRTPYGIPLFWPLSSHHFLSPVQLFPGVHHGQTTDASIGEWLQGIFHWRNLLSIGTEILVIAPAALLGNWVNQRREPGA